MPPRTFLAAATALLVLFGSFPALASDDFTFEGSGYGHGIGLSQYGAKGMAQTGSTAEAIIAHYYQGTDLRDITQVVPASSHVRTQSAPAWVNLIQHTESVVVSATVGPASACFDDTATCPLTINPGETWRFTRVLATTCEYQRWNGFGWDAGAASGTCNGSVQPASGGGFYLDARAREYRGGTLRVRQAPQTGKLHVLHQTGLESYLRGVSEMPESWPTEALRAQVLASRSFAVHRLITVGAPSTFTEALQELCWCNLFSTTADQVYGGYTAQVAHPQWTALVNASPGQLVAFQGSVALTVFSSSSGGATENNADYWGAAQVPYLVSVDDSAAHTPAAANPYSVWTITKSQTPLASALGVSWVFDAVISSRHVSGSVGSVTFRTIDDGRPKSIITSGRFVQETLGLRSHWFTMATLPRFSDVSPSHAFAGEILGLSELGVTKGCTEDGSKFCPQQSVTRGQMAAFIVRAFGLTGNTSGDPFTDDTGIFEDDIEILYSNGITFGCNETGTLFCPTAVVTRGQMAAFLVRTLGLAANPGGDPFTDDSGIFENAIEELHAAGITSGCNPEGTKYCPNNPVTRGQMAAFIVRSLAHPLTPTTGPPRRPSCHSG